jgi:hypothetical protein
MRSDGSAIWTQAAAASPPGPPPITATSTSSMCVLLRSALIRAGLLLPAGRTLFFITELEAKKTPQQGGFRRKELDPVYTNGGICSVCEVVLQSSWQHQMSHRFQRYYCESIIERGAINAPLVFMERRHCFLIPADDIRDLQSLPHKRAMQATESVFKRPVSPYCLSKRLPVQLSPLLKALPGTALLP